MKKVLSFVLALPVLLALYVFLWPSPIDPVSWQPAQSEGLVGDFSPNDILSSYQEIRFGDEYGPESLVRGPDGLIYVALHSGAIFRFDPTNPQPEPFSRVAGRVLGMAFHPDGRLIAADAMTGITAIDQDGKAELLIAAEGQPDFGYTNAIAISERGDIFFTNSSARHAAATYGDTFIASTYSIMEHQAQGTLYAWTAHAQALGQPPEVMLTDLCFANGVAFDDQGNLFVAETCEYRVWKVDINARDLSAKALVDQKNDLAWPILVNLPGFPDNLSQGYNGKVWVGLVKPRSNLIDGLADKPWLREAIFNLPQSMMPIPPHYSHVVAFNVSGEVLHSMQDPSLALETATGVLESEQGLFVSSLTGNFVAWLN